MSLMRVTSPHAHGPLSTATVMRLVLLATLPGVLALTHFFGFGTLVNIAWACLVAVACEAAALKLRRRPLGFYLGDSSALVTATLLAIAMPPGSPWWLIAVGVAFAIIIAKHLYGGLGYNPFNPAMVGYVVLLISFPVEMTAWLAPAGVGGIEGGGAGGIETPGLREAIAACFFPATVDAVTMATPLDLLKHNSGLSMEALQQRHAQFGRWGGVGWEWVNIGFLLGGCFLLYNRIFSWHAPVAMLAGLCLTAAAFHYGGYWVGSWGDGSGDGLGGGLGNGSGAGLGGGLGNGSGAGLGGGSPLFHLLSGGTMFGAFFIVTDPVTSAVSVRGRLIYGALIGVLIYIIRLWGNYPDAVAFAVLIMNFAAPFIDHYTQPRTYGHGGKR